MCIRHHISDNREKKIRKKIRENIQQGNKILKKTTQKYLWLVMRYTKRGRGALNQFFQNWNLICQVYQREY